MSNTGVVQWWSGICIWWQYCCVPSAQLDDKIVIEFGGSPGCTAIMIFSPILMYYFWACIEYYQGALQYPGSVEGETLWDVLPYLSRMWGHVYEGAYPTLKAFQIYTYFMIFQVCLWEPGAPLDDSSQTSWLPLRAAQEPPDKLLRHVQGYP